MHIAQASLFAILVVGTKMPHSSWGNASPYDLTFHRSNKPRLSSLVAFVTVVAVVAVHRGKSATSVPVSSVLEGLQPRVADSVAPSPAVVTVSPCLISPASEPDAPRSKLRAGSNLLTDSGLISVW